MEKPIVCCNPMAMCESIATTCCYSLVGYSPATFTTTLHGGVLKAVYHYTYYVGNAQAAVVRINGSWLQFTKGHVTYDYADTCIPYQEDGTWYIRRLNTNETLTLEQAKAISYPVDNPHCLRLFQRSRRTGPSTASSRSGFPPGGRRNAPFPGKTCITT